MQIFVLQRTDTGDYADFPHWQRGHFDDWCWVSKINQARCLIAEQLPREFRSACGELRPEIHIRIYAEPSPARPGQVLHKTIVVEKVAVRKD